MSPGFYWARVRYKGYVNNIETDCLGEWKPVEVVGSGEVWSIGCEYPGDPKDFEFGSEILEPKEGA